MSFTDHLGELRSRLLRSLLAVAVLFFVAYAFHDRLFRIIARPVMQALRAHGIYALQALQVTETITVYIQVSLVAAIILAAPYIFYQLWAFVAPGLYSREKRYVLPIVILISAFFVLGVVFCYFVFLPMVVDFLVGFTIGSGDITLLPTVEKTFGFTTLFPLVFGLLFQLPLLMFFLSLLGVVDHVKLLRFSRYFVVLSFLLGALFTPPDPLSQALMAVPICLLYFVGVAFSWVAGLLRRDGPSRVLPTVVATTIVLVFAALIVTASYLWNHQDESPDIMSAASTDAQFIMRANPASSIGRSVLGAAGVPKAVLDADNLPESVFMVGKGGPPAWLAWGGGYKCAGRRAGDGGLCVLAGEWQAPTAENKRPVDSPESSRVGDMTKGPVALKVRAECLGKVTPFGMGPGGASGLNALVIAEPSGLFRVELEFMAAGEGGTPLSTAGWPRSGITGFRKGCLGPCCLPRWAGCWPGLKGISN
ncbi:MAG: twin-arginine translocase subunit TatC [Deltaproteobacteria bacterium]|nr:twin-arginine translocase subunit TatC [Deltaproteobacteria bacterium]